MAKPMLGTSSKGKPMHYSVGAIIQRNQKILLIDRKKFPFGFACPAGHIDENELPEDALAREIMEETGMKLESSMLSFEEEIDWNTCRHGIDVHHWYVYKVRASGEFVLNLKESKSGKFYTRNEIRNLRLEPLWKYWFGKLGIYQNIDS